jgi:hypothetical protein
MCLKEGYPPQPDKVVLAGDRQFASPTCILAGAGSHPLHFSNNV